MTDKARTLQARYNKGLSTHRAETSGVAIPIDGVAGNQGVMVTLEDGAHVYAIWSEEQQCYITIRKLTPRECFRLQGVPDEYFDRAAFVNSDSQLYKQSGNAVTVPVIKAIGERIVKCQKKE